MYSNYGSTLLTCYWFLIVNCSLTYDHQKGAAVYFKKLEPYNPSRIGIFGSYVRGDQNEESDLDLLVNLQKRANLFELIELEEELSEILGVKVDLVTEKLLNKHIRPHIMKEITYILNEE